MKKRLLWMAFTLYTVLMICACGRQKESIALEEIDTQKEMAAESQVFETLSKTVYVRVDSCKVKTGPGEEYETAGTLGLLEELWVTGKVTDHGGTEWYQILVPNILERECLPEGDYYVLAEHVKE